MSAHIPPCIDGERCGGPHCPPDAGHRVPTAPIECRCKHADTSHGGYPEIQSLGACALCDCRQFNGSKLGWWAIQGEVLISMLRRCSAGEDPDLVYAEEYANSDHEWVDPA